MNSWPLSIDGKHLPDMNTASGSRVYEPFVANPVLSEEQRWSREFGPVVKVDQLVRKMIPNDETKEPFARF